MPGTHRTIAPENCPDPSWHETHRYCPEYSWTEEPAAKPQIITARFYVSQIIDYGNIEHVTVTLMPAYSEGQNQQWAKATPSGKIELSIDSKLPAAEFFRNLLRDKGHNVAIEFSVVAKGH